jgi:hypothetical protein
MRGGWSHASCGTLATQFLNPAQAPLYPTFKGEAALEPCAGRTDATL